MKKLIIINKQQLLILFILIITIYACAFITAIIGGIMATNEESSKLIFQGSLYTVEERLKTFNGAHWPYDSGSCTPLKVSL